MQTKLCQYKSPDLQLFILEKWSKGVWSAQKNIFYKKETKLSRTTDVMIQKPKILFEIKKISERTYGHTYKWSTSNTTSGVNSEW